MGWSTWLLRRLPRLQFRRKDDETFGGDGDSQESVEYMGPEDSLVDELNDVINLLRADGDEDQTANLAKFANYGYPLVENTFNTGSSTRKKKRKSSLMDELTDVIN